MKLYLYNRTGHTMIETDVVEEAERILRECQQKGATVFIDDSGVDVTLPIRFPLPKEINVLYPIQGGAA